MSIRLAGGIALLGACALSAACAKSENKADSTAAMAMDTTTKAVAPTPAPALTDANIAALLDEANAADSSNGALAVTKVTASSAKEFARMMMHDHHVLRKQGQELAAKLNLTPQAPANDSLPAMVKVMVDSLTATPKGAGFDKLYIDDEVMAHQHVIALLQTAVNAAQDTSLKALIIKAQPLIQAHLTRAQAIQAKLAAAPATKAN